MDTSDAGLSQHARAVDHVTVPAGVTELSTLTRVDYADAFLLQTEQTRRYTPEQWSRLMLADAPIATRTRLLIGWSLLGLKLRRNDSGSSILGWELRTVTAEFMLLGAASRIGMPAELLFKPTPSALLFCTFVQRDTAIARALWAIVEPVHVRVVREVLEDTERRLRSIL